MNHLMMCTKEKLDHIILRPTLSVSLSHKNIKTGENSGPRSLSFSACITLWNAMLWILGMMLAMRIFWWLFKMRECRKMKKKMRRGHRKMSKS